MSEKPEQVVQNIIDEALESEAGFDDFLAHGVLHKIKDLEHELRKIKGFSNLLEQAIEAGEVDLSRREENRIDAERSAVKIRQKLAQMRALLVGYQDLSGLEPFSNLE